MAVPVSDKYKVVDVHQPTYTMTRVTQYFHDQTSGEFLENTIFPIVASTFAGALTGGGIGFCAGGPAGMGVGAGIGGGIGLAGGCAYSTYSNYSAYHQWLALYKETEVFKDFEKLYQHEPSLQEFIDPVSYCLILDPVLDPFGRLYDRSTLLGLSRQRNDGIISDPFRNGDYSMDQVENAPHILAKMKKIFITLLGNELNTDITPEVKEGLQSLINDLTKQVTNYVTREMTTLLQELKSGQITMNQYTVKSKWIHDNL